MLNINDLNNGFKSLMNPNYSNFKGYFDNENDVAENWTNIFKEFYLNMKLPIPGSSNVNFYSALKKFQTEFLLAIKSNSVIDKLEILIMDLHFELCKGVDALGIYKTIPPSSVLRLKRCFSYKLSPDIISEDISQKIFKWVSFTYSIQSPNNIIIKWI